MPATKRGVLTWSESLVTTGALGEGKSRMSHSSNVSLGEDLAHWVFVLIVVILFTGGGIVYSLYSPQPHCVIDICV